MVLDVSSEACVFGGVECGGYAVGLAGLEGVVGWCSGGWIWGCQEEGGGLREEAYVNGWGIYVVR